MREVDRPPLRDHIETIRDSQLVAGSRPFGPDCGPSFSDTFTVDPRGGYPSR